MKYLGRYLRFDWPVHFLLLLVNWLPDNVVCLRLRGWLIKPFIGSCGSHLLVARHVTFHNPINIHLGNNAFIAYGCMMMATAQIVIGDEVMFGPHCVVVSGNHTRQDGSYRRGPAQLAPISIGKGTWIGAHSVITAGSRIGSGSVIAAGAVVNGDIPDGVLAGGVPAKVIKALDG